MSVVVAGRPSADAGITESMAEFGGAWRLDRDGAVVCDAPGIYVADGVVRFVLPRCYADAAPEGSAALRAALVLLRVLTRYREYPDRRAVDDSFGDATLREVGDIRDDLGWLEVALMLAEDWERSGALYISTPEVSPRRQGRVHWARTQQRAFHVVDGPDVMTSPMWRSRRGIDPEDTLTQLHVDTCSAIRAMLGRGGGTGARWTSAEALSVLNAREYTLFADRHRQVARWLRHYWTTAAGGLSGRRAGVAALWSPQFPLVWECMLRDVMGGRPLRMPPGTYHLVGAPPQVGLRLIPDFTVRVGHRLLVVDAKHYSLDDLPRTESIAKQLLYRWFASRESGHGTVALADVASVFIVPVVASGAPKVVGRHVLAGETGGAHPFGGVLVLAADFEGVADAYVGETTLPQLADVAASSSWDTAPVLAAAV